MDKRKHTASVEPARCVPPYISDPHQQFHRSPDPYFVHKNDAEFVRNSARALQVFIEFFNRIAPDRLNGEIMRETMDNMRRVYGGGHEPVYREIEINFRAARTRSWITRNYGFEAMQKLGLPQAALEVYQDRNLAINGETDGVRIPLPGIDHSRWPTFLAGDTHQYPTLDEGTIQLFYHRMAEELSLFAAQLAGKTKNTKAALNTVVDFGRLAAAFRQYRNGNWALYGPMINEMVRRLGFNIEYPGYLDILMHGATEESLKRFFPVALEHNLPLFSEDGENPVISREMNEKNQPKAAKAIASWKAEKLGKQE